MKTDGSGKALSEIKVGLADAAANSKGGKYLKNDADGNVVYPSDNNYSSSLADYTVTTGADGKATWSGLSAAKDASQTYYYVELKTDSSPQFLTGLGAAQGLRTYIPVDNLNESWITAALSSDCFAAIHLSPFG